VWVRTAGRGHRQVLGMVAGHMWRKMKRMAGVANCIPEGDKLVLLRARAREREEKKEGFKTTRKGHH